MAEFKMGIYRLFAPLKYFSLVATICSFAGALLMFYIGAVKTAKAIANYLAGVRPADAAPHLSLEDLAISGVIESLDTFLLALVLIYFGFAIFFLYVVKKDEQVTENIPAWLIPSSIGDLKETLAQVIVVILFVLFVRVIWESLDHLSWELLILPASILLLALSLKVLGLKGH